MIGCWGRAIGQGMRIGHHARAGRQIISGRHQVGGIRFVSCLSAGESLAAVFLRDNVQIAMPHDCVVHFARAEVSKNLATD